MAEIPLENMTSSFAKYPEIHTWKWTERTLWNKKSHAIPIYIQIGCCMKEIVFKFWHYHLRKGSENSRAAYSSLSTIELYSGIW